MHKPLMGNHGLYTGERPYVCDFEVCHKNLKHLDTQKIAVIILKFKKCVFSRVVCPKDTDGMANSIYPDQTAPTL